MAAHIYTRAIFTAIIATLWISPAAAQDTPEPPADMVGTPTTPPLTDITSDTQIEATVETPSPALTPDFALPQPPLPTIPGIPAGPALTAPAFAPAVPGLADPRGRIEFLNNGAPGFTYVSVLPHDPAAEFNYYLIFQIVCDQNLQAGTDSCLPFVVQNSGRYGYGPSALGGRKVLRPGMNYYLIPICSTPARWEHRKLLSVSETTTEVRLKCPR